MIIECPKCEGNPISFSYDYYGNEYQAECPDCDGQGITEIDDPEALEEVA